MIDVQARTAFATGAASAGQQSTVRAAVDPTLTRRPRLVTLWDRVLRGDATKDQAKDTGMAAVLVLLLVAVAKHRNGYVGAAVIVHVVNMVWPSVFRPAAVLWFWLSHVLGTVASKVLMAAVFFVFVTPIAAVRRAMGADALRLRAFKRGRGSVMRERNHTFTGKDMEQPY